MFYLISKVEDLYQYPILMLFFVTISILEIEIKILDSSNENTYQILTEPVSLDK